jgi:hypothetical protein
MDRDTVGWIVSGRAGTVATSAAAGARALVDRKFAIPARFTGDARHATNRRTGYVRRGKNSFILMRTKIRSEQRGQAGPGHDPGINRYINGDPGPVTA